MNNVLSTLLLNTQESKFRVKSVYNLNNVSLQVSLNTNCHTQKALSFFSISVLPSLPTCEQRGDEEDDSELYEELALPRAVYRVGLSVVDDAERVDADVEGDDDDGQHARHQPHRQPARAQLLHRTVQPYAEIESMSCFRN